MPRSANPSWKNFGAHLRKHRKALGLRQVDVAKTLDVAGSYYSAWELGHRRVDGKYVNDLDKALKASGRIAKAWEACQRETRTPMRFAELPDLEGQAVQIREFQPLVIPGLVQTEEYARAVFEDTFPGLNSASVDLLVQGRIERQEIFARQPQPLVLLVITESVLHQQVGGRGPDVLRHQLQRVLSEIQAGRVRVQIVPHDTPHHYGNGGAFRLYTLTDELPVASAEYMTGEEVISDTDRYQECLTNFGLLQGEAHPEGHSRQLIEKLIHSE